MSLRPNRIRSSKCPESAGLLVFVYCLERKGMNMNTVCDLEVQCHCLQAEVIYDLFHVVARLGKGLWGGRAVYGGC